MRRRYVGFTSDKRCVVKTYSDKDIRDALEAAGVKKGDLIFFFVRLHTLGRIEGCTSKEAFCEAYLRAIFDVIGEKGTLVVPTYSQQIGRFGVPYDHKNTPTLCGVFSEFIRTYPSAVRSFHPVFSLTALGGHANEICGNVGVNAFGAKSAYDNLFKRGGHSICLGFEYATGHIVAGAHYIECSYGVPYYYNKIVQAEVYKDGKRCDKVFTINVRYLDFGVKNSYKKFIEELDGQGHVQSRPIGGGMLYSSDLKQQLEVGYELLSEDVYSFLESPPVWKEGDIPFEGPLKKLNAEDAEKMNWSGFILHEWRDL